MDDRTNTIAGWVLAACAGALGLSIASGMYFHAERPEKMGYPIEGVVEEGAGGGAAEVPIATLLAAADPAKGAEVFKKCAACHTINAGGPNGIGPNLHGTLGKGVAAGQFAYSDALKAVGGNWDFDKMNAWLTSPRKFAPGTKMTFAGLGDPKERADVIAYLNAQGSNLPLPAAPTANPDPAGAEPPAGNDAAAGSGAPAEDPGNLSDKAAPPPGATSVDPNAAKEFKARN